MRELRTEEEIINSWQGDSAKPIVSISCVTYNHEKYIRDAIEGFIIQKTTFPFKIFILDDASTDHNVEIIREYESKYPRLFSCFFLKENTWGKPNRREIVKPFLEARNEGKYIALCEGDDYWTDPYKLQKQVDFLEANPKYTLTGGYAIKIYENEDFKVFHETPKYKNSFDFDDHFLMKVNPIATLTACFRNGIVNQFPKI